jgi:acyl-coenzyme A synthetase/AMP-(fatty) acid ligase
MGRFLRRKLVDAGLPDDSAWEVPPRFNFTRDVVETLASDPLRPALTFVDREGVIDRRTFADVASDASRWAGLLRGRGLVAGERVLVAVGRTPAWHGILLGALKAGLVAVPCPETLSAAELAFRAERSDARLVVVDAERASRVAGTDAAMGVIVLEDVAAEVKALPVAQQTHDTAATDVAFVLFTPGTAGAPKGVAVTHAGTWAARLQAEHWLDARPGDLVWSTGSTGLASSILTILLGPWSRGAETVIHDGTFDVDRHLDLLLRLGATVICQSPAEYRQLVDRAAGGGPELGRVRHAVSTGEPLTAELVLAFREAFGITVCEGYGQTENTILAANTRAGSIRPGSLGLPLPGHEVAVIDADGNELPHDAEGDLALGGKPPSLFAGYWDDPDLTAAAFRGTWYVTGDRARRDPDGYLWFAGRAEAPSRELATAPVADAGVPEQDDAAALRAREADARAAEILALEQAAATEAVNAERIRLEEARLRKQERAAAAAQAAEAEAAARAARRADLERRTAEALAKEEARRERDRAEAAAAEQARLEEEARLAAERRRAEAAAAAAAEEQARREAAQARRDAEEEAARRRDEQRAAEAAAATEERETAARASTPGPAKPDESAAPVALSGRAARKEQERRRKEEEKARKEAEREQQEEEKARKEAERKQQEEERAAAAERRRQEAEEQRAAAERGREAERRRKEEEKRLREEQKAAAEQERREAERRVQEARAAAEAQRIEEARQRAAAEEARKEAERQRKAEEKRRQEEEKRQEEEDRKRFGKSRRPPVPEPGDEHLEEERPNAELIARLRAYGLRERDDASDEDEQPTS